ncbi:MAG: tyrosine-type recombinase/integrase, partial [Planctomycetota bacterium]
ACLDKGNSPATVNKKLRSLRRIFQLAVERGQLEVNPFRYVSRPKSPRQKIRVYTNKECVQMIGSSRILLRPGWMQWDLLILMALSTAMRRGELLNTTWSDIDFEKLTIEVSPKKDTRQTWEWLIKDTDRRTLPLTEEVVALLAEHHAKQPEGYPYVFLPAKRYDYLQNVRMEGRWKQRYGTCPVNNFTRIIRKIQKHASVKEGEFRDFRRTCLTNWLTNGLGEYDVMHLAGHADFQTTHRFYLAVREDLIDRTREITQANSVANLLQHPNKATSSKAENTTSL